MKIRKVKWSNHPILRNLELDFVSDSGHPYNTVVFAGENGTGKSTILEALSTFLNLGSFDGFEFIEYEANGSIYKAIQPQDSANAPGFHDIEDSTGNITKIRANRHNNREAIESNALDIRHSGCVYSKARSDYKTNKIKATTTSALDKEKYDTDTTDDFTSLKQIIVDIVNQDNSDYMEQNKALGPNPKSWSEFYVDSKIYRFKNSFDNFFENLKYEKVEDRQDEKTIIFTKNGNSISVDQLSTGEKQIVFRGIYLLKNSNVLNGSAIMIDEPELSMHPKWQKKILKYYLSLFHEGTQQKAQVFFATHSEHVLEEALIDQNNNLVITLEENNGLIHSRRIDSPSVLPTITGAETTYLAFDVVTNDYHIELYGWLQDKENRRAIKNCDDFIKNHSKYEASRHRKTSSFGNTTYDSLSTYIRNAIHHPDSGNTFTEEELRTSIELLIELCR